MFTLLVKKGEGLDYILVYQIIHTQVNPSRPILRTLILTGFFTEPES